MFDPTEQVSCPSCHCKKPFLCSKCNIPINHHDIFGIEKLKTKRPLLCKACGTDNEVVKCPICKLSQVRSLGVTVSELEGANVYHKECLEKRREVIRMADYAAYIAIGATIIIGITVHKNPSYMMGSFAIGAIAFVIIKMYKTIVTPH